MKAILLFLLAAAAGRNPAHEVALTREAARTTAPSAPSPPQERLLRLLYDLGLRRLDRRAHCHQERTLRDGDPAADRPMGGSFVSALELHQATESDILFQARIGGFDFIQTFRQIVRRPLSMRINQNVEKIQRGFRVTAGQIILA